MSVPQRVTHVTIGARDMTGLRAFYGRWGWQEREGSDDDFTTYQVGSFLLALYPIGLLAAEAAPGEPARPQGWNGVTFGMTVDSGEAVDEVLERAIAAGARAVAPAIQRHWGGYSGYVADPEGNRWEIAWAPGVEDEPVTQG